MRPLLLALFLIPFMAAAGVCASAADDPDAEEWEAPAWTDRLALTGWLEAIRSAAVRETDETITSRARLRLNLEADLEYAFASVSADIEKNWVIDSQSGAGLHEFWLEHVGDGWDVRLGRQTIIWGKADGVQITDVICPPDYTESITRDLDEIRMPVDAVKFRLLDADVDTELIWIPVYREAVLPDESDNPWNTGASLPPGLNVVRHRADKPGLSPADGEAAVRMSVYREGYDYSLSAFYTWDDYKTRHRTVSPVGPTLTVSPEYHRLLVLGMGASRPWSDFVFRSEVAAYVGRYRETTRLDIGPRRKHSVKWLGGVDWTPGNDWTVIGQFFGESILDHESVLADEEHELSATLNVSKDLMRQTLTLSCMAYYNINDQDSLLRPEADYEVADGFHLFLGADLFNGRRSGGYGQYGDNSQVWFKAKYSF